MDGASVDKGIVERLLREWAPVFRAEATHADTASLNQCGPSGEGSEDYKNLRAAMEALSDKERQILALRFLENLSQIQIAQRLNTSQTSVSNRQYRALKRLCDLLGNRPGTLSQAHPKTRG
jgi:DNA-directed RNA polymerase specialized sigma subunit